MKRYWLTEQDLILMKEAARFIEREADNNCASNADENGYVDSRGAWEEITHARRLAKNVRALAKRGGIET